MLQAPPEKREVFAGELLRVGIEGAKVLCEVGSKVEKMEKLSPKNILVEVHEAAEELQMKIDQNSYILVNPESWQGERRPKEFGHPQNFIDGKENENKNMVITSLSESWEAQNPHLCIDSSMPDWTSSENVLNYKPISWPHFQFNANAILEEQESKIYESASSLSLATFTSLLIEFVARLQNVVDEFEELSEEASFKEPKDTSDAEEEVGFWTKLFRGIQYKNSKPVSVGSTS